MSAEPALGADVHQTEHKSLGNAYPGPVEPLAGLGPHGLDGALLSRDRCRAGSSTPASRSLSANVLCSILDTQLRMSVHSPLEDPSHSCCPVLALQSRPHLPSDWQQTLLRAGLAASTPSTGFFTCLNSPSCGCGSWLVHLSAKRMPSAAFPEAGKQQTQRRCSSKVAEGQDCPSWLVHKSLFHTEMEAREVSVSL